MRFSGGVKRLIFVVMMVIMLNYMRFRFIEFIKGKNSGMMIRMIEVVFRIVLRKSISMMRIIMI